MNEDRIVKRIYFGLEDYNPSVNYIQDDINRLFRSLIKMWVVGDLLSIASIRKTDNNGVEMVFGNWVHSAALAEIYQSIQTEMLVDMRLLLSTERYNSKGMMKKSLEKCEPGNQTGGSFLLDIKALKNTSTELADMINEYRRAGYYEEIIRNNEKMRMHKDSGPQKRFLDRTVVSGNVTVNFYQSNEKYDSEKIINAVEGYSTIVILYLGPSLDDVRRRFTKNLNNYISDLYMLFSDEWIRLKVEESINKTINTVRRLFPNTISIIGWN